MVEPIRRRTPLIEPVYLQTEPNQPIELGSLAIEFEHKGKLHRNKADFIMRFAREDRFEFVYPNDDEFRIFGLGFFDPENPYKKIDVVDRGVSFEAFCVAAGNDRGGAVFTPTRTPVLMTQPSTKIVSAKFHLFNAPDFYGPENYVLLIGEPPNQGGKGCGCVTLKASGWKITIAATDQTDDLTKSLKANGGYVITHMGLVEREDSSEFSSEMLTGLLAALHHFLSFAFGRWAGVALAIGFDAQGNRCHEECGPRKTADGHWRGASSWFDAHHAELLSQTFPGFMTLWQNQLWNKPLMHTLYWYLGACDRRIGVGPDTALILAQAALEVLAWTHCILDRKIVSPFAFKPRALSAADKLRLLASSLDIPKEIPQQLTALHAKAGRKWTDVPDAITGIRNSLVHPDSNETLPEHSYYEAWNLSLWLIEMVLLRLCGHDGSYANRLAGHRWIGVVEKVPWVSPEDETA